MTDTIVIDNAGVSFDTEVFFHSGSAELNEILGDLIDGGHIGTRLLTTSGSYDYYLAIYPDQNFNTRRMLKCVSRLIEKGYMTYVDDSVKIEDPYDSRGSYCPDTVYLKLTEKALVAIGTSNVDATTPGLLNTDAAVDEFILQYMTPRGASVFLREFQASRKRGNSSHRAFALTVAAIIDYAAYCNYGDVKQGH